MKLKNYQEDLVLYVADLVLQERPDIEHNESFLHDVAAYTLNRLPPRYIHSERGFTRLAADHWVDGSNGQGLASLVEVLLLVHKAIDTIQHRRKSQIGPESGGSDAPGEAELPDPLGYWHNLPYLIGRVVDRDSDEAIEGVSVSIELDGQPAEAAEGNWQNPYRTSRATRGFYSFLPRPQRSRSRNRHFTLRIVLEHPDYETQSLERALHTEGDYTRQQAILSDQILDLGFTPLQRRS
jgi:hypothetical protein